MNILFVSEHAVHFGGIGAVIDQLCLQLQRLGHRCYLYTGQAIPAQYGSMSFDGVVAGPLAAPARISDFRQHRDNRYAWRAMSNTLDKWQIDLIHCHEVHRSLYTAGHCANCPIIASSHGGIFHKRYSKKRVTRAYRRFAHKIRFVTALNPAMAETLHRRFGTLFEVVTIPNGIEDSWLQLQAGVKKDILLCAGRLSADKRYDLALEAYAASSSRHRFSLVIAGEGETRQDLVALAEAKQIKVSMNLPDTAAPDTLYLCGYQTGSGKKQLFARARLFLHPSRFEAFGIVLLEAMAQRALPICAELATYRSQFPAQDFHLAYVPEFDTRQWADAIDHWSQSDKLAAICRDNHAAIQAFSWSQVFEQYMACYRAALADSNVNPVR